MMQHHLSMYTTHGGIHLTSLYCNKEEIQFVKYHRTACISTSDHKSNASKDYPRKCLERWNGLTLLARRCSDKYRKRERCATPLRAEQLKKKEIYAFN